MKEKHEESHNGPRCQFMVSSAHHFTFTETEVALIQRGRKEVLIEDIIKSEYIYKSNYAKHFKAKKTRHLC